MTKRIFRSICLAAIGVFLASAALFMWVLYEYFSTVQTQQLRTETQLAAKAVAAEGRSYLDGLDTSRFRITLVDPSGTVLYDSGADAGTMENHLEREEIRAALTYGAGESSRHSATLTERAFYRAQKLPDGTVLRLSMTQRSILTLLLGMTQPILLIMLIAVALSLTLASRLSKQIVRPLNALDLDNPLSNEDYDELAPLFHRLDSQQRQIAKQSEKLREKQRELETITDNMNEGIILVNARGAVLAINRAARRVFAAGETCVGQDILSVNRSLEITGLVAAALKGQHGESLTEFAGGKYQLLASPVLSDGNVSGAVLLALDVTEREQREQLRREFSANVSHELKSPLHAIAGSAELLLEGVVKAGDERGFYERVYAEAKRMIHLVDDIIGLSRLDEGAAGAREDCGLGDVAAAAVRDLTPAAEQAGVTLRLEGGNPIVNGVPRLLSGIAFNLVENAVKYNKPGGSVTVTVSEDEDTAVLAVSDTGIGIPPEHQARVFERFYRVDKSRSKEGGGTGLGLSIVKHAAAVHSADVKLESAVGEGTTVTVRFPKRGKK